MHPTLEPTSIYETGKRNQRGGKGRKIGFKGNVNQERVGPMKQARIFKHTINRVYVLKE